MDTQRELTKLKGAKKDKAAGLGGSNSGTSSSAGGGGGNAEETDMLEITLGMLRCSVCKDRFKSCAITRYAITTCVALNVSAYLLRFVLFAYCCFCFLCVGVFICSARSALMRICATGHANAPLVGRSLDRMTSHQCILTKVVHVVSYVRLS